MTAYQGTPPHPLRASPHDCSACSLGHLCLPLNLSQYELGRLERIVMRHRPLQRDEHLYYAGDRLHFLYVVRAGSLKTYAVTRAGEQQINGFSLPGDLVGFDAVDTGSHAIGVVALETTSVCAIPFAKLESLAASIPALQHRLLQLMSDEIVVELEMHKTLAQHTAETRLARALLNLSQRLARRGCSPYRFRLPMSQADLGNYLGLASETICRLFMRFRRCGWLCADGRELLIRDMAAP